MAKSRASVPRGRIFICGNTCGHDHEGVNSPTGCCAEHGPYMYFCATCHDERAARQAAREDDA